MAYRRFKDDILIIADDEKRNEVREFLWNLKRRAGYYALEFEVRRDEVRFLDLVIRARVHDETILKTHEFGPSALHVFGASAARSFFVAPRDDAPHHASV